MNTFKRLIAWLFEKYVLDDVIDKAYETVTGYSDVWVESDLNIRRHKPDVPRAEDGVYNIHPRFDNEIDCAMYEKEFHTLQ